MRHQGAKLVRQVGHFGLLSCPEWGGPASVSRLMLIDAAQCPGQQVLVALLPPRMVRACWVKKSIEFLKEIIRRLH